MLRAAVIGVGYLGKFHAEKYAKLDDIELVAVADLDESSARSVAKKCKTAYTTDYRELAGKVDLVSIAVHTSAHYEVSRFFLENNVHVLVEKPITETLEQAKILIELADKHDVKFQVGHLERFNPVVTKLKPYLNKTHFIESNRLAAFSTRCLDVNVILDLMIHDIDIIQTIVDSPIKSIDAIGSSVLSDKIDIANARIRFANHSVADVTASRVSFKSERKIRLFQQDAYISVDLQDLQMSLYQKGEGEMFPGIPQVAREVFKFKKADALFDEIKSFVNAIKNDETPLVTGEEGLRSLQTAYQITEIIESHLQKIETEETI